jgi:hypothetical protein
MIRPDAQRRTERAILDSTALSTFEHPNLLADLDEP